MPSWYNLFFATFGAAALLRYLEVRTRRWLFVAGVCGGLSILMKVIGAYYIAGVLLFLAFLEQSESSEKGSEKSAGGEIEQQLALSRLQRGRAAALPGDTHQRAAHPAGNAGTVPVRAAISGGGRADPVGRAECAGGNRATVQDDVSNADSVCLRLGEPDNCFPASVCAAGRGVEIPLWGDFECDLAIGRSRSDPPGRNRENHVCSAAGGSAGSGNVLG